MDEHQTRLCILVVEDDALIGMLLAEILVGLGHGVCGVATTETDAVAAAARHRPDLMLVDVELVHGNGLSAMRTIEQLATLPHIFMTDDRRTAHPAKANVLLKPFSAADLARALHQACGRLSDAFEDALMI